MKIEELKQYIKTVEVKSDCKYLIFIDKASGPTAHDLRTIINSAHNIMFCYVKGNPNDLISVIEA